MLVLAIVVLFSIVSVILAYLRIYRKLSTPLTSQPHIAVVLGSGGHTGEMLTLLTALEPKIPSANWTFIIADSDTVSTGKLSLWLQERSIQFVQVKTIPRSRQVGQSFFTSVFSTVKAVFYSVALMSQIRPNAIITNGPGTAVPIVFAGILLELFSGQPIVLFLAESFCRTESLSLTCRMLRPFADEFFVYWPLLQEKYPRSILLA